MEDLNYMQRLNDARMRGYDDALSAAPCNPTFRTERENDQYVIGYKNALRALSAVHDAEMDFAEERHSHGKMLFGVVMIVLVGLVLALGAMHGWWSAQP